jgi:hypothetical protein
MASSKAAKHKATGYNLLATTRTALLFIASKIQFTPSQPLCRLTPTIFKTADFPENGSARVV